MDNGLDTSYLKAASERAYSHYLSELMERCVECNETEGYDFDDDYDENEDCDYYEEDDEDIDPDVDGQTRIDYRGLRM